jgi:hyperosmotically inducible periplasmic protein
MRQVLGNALIILFLLTAPSISVGSRSVLALAQNPQDAEIKADVMNRALNKSKFKDVTANVADGVVTLGGTVDLFDTKAEAERRTHRIKNVKAVDNEIQVAGGDISDSELQDKLVTAISRDRIGYGTTAFNAIGVHVQNGVVTLTGTAYGPVDADSAVAVAANTKGVKDVINEISVNPVSPMDDQIRLATFRAIYGFPSLNRYAIDPVKPIRISVQNGNVTLYGVVDSQADKDAAGIRANTVPGVFHVTNNLQVAGQERERK